MTVNAKMTAIADALRLKGNGAAGKYSLDDMAAAALNLGYANIPAYHYAEAGRVVHAVRAWRASHPNSLIFGAMTDNHVFANDATREQNTQRSARHAAFALETVGCMAECDFIANLGDNCWENGIDTANALEGAQYVHDATLAAFARIPSYRLVGNHDKTNDTALLYSLNGAYNDFDAWGTTQLRGFGYKDYTAKKVRVICLSSIDYLNHSGGYGMSYDQKDFLIRALDLSAKSDAASWQILLLSHIPLDYAGGDYNTGADIAAILAAYESGGSVSITVTSSYAKNEDPTKYATYSGGKLVYNYSGKNVAKIIANIHGHVHNTSRGKLNASDIVRISTPNSCFYETYQSKYGYGVSAEEYAKLVKVEGTAKDTAAMFYCIDLAEKSISAFSYGAGADFVVAYITNKHAITLNLTNATSSNTAATVDEGAAYSTTIAAKAGYNLSGVKVTMGGVDITSTAYSGGVVSIASVTGNVVITASAEVQTSYTNLFSTSDPDYSVGRLSSSGSVNTSYTGGFVSGFIAAASGDVIRAKSASTAFANTYPVIAFYKSDKTVIGTIYTNDSAGRVVLSADSKEFTSDTNSGFNSSFNAIAFFRVMGFGSPDGFIITKNEAIE